MSETTGQAGGTAPLPQLGIGEILRAAFALYRRHWRTLLAVAAVVAVPLTLLQYGIGHWVRGRGEELDGEVVVSTSFWAVVSAALLAALVALLLYQVLTGAITRTIATEVAGQGLDLEQSYRFGFARLWPILVVSILVGLATLLGPIVFIIPGIFIGVRLAVSTHALVVEGKRGTEALRRSWDLVAVQRRRLVRPGRGRGGGYDGDAAVQRAGRRAALPGPARPQGTPRPRDPAGRPAHLGHLTRAC
jgi:hypothetical protein